MLDDLTVLIIEDQFLIALDMERIVRDAGASDIRSFRDYAGAVAALPGLTGTHLGLLAPPANSALELPFALGLKSGGAALVICSADSDYARGVPGLDCAEIVIKPFTEGQLLEAIGLALEKRVS